MVQGPQVRENTALIQTRSLQASPMMMKTESGSKVALGITNRSIAAICVEVVAKEISRPSPRGEAACLIMYFATLD